jgi:hypothetical protein
MLPALLSRGAQAIKERSAAALGAAALQLRAAIAAQAATAGDAHSQSLQRHCGPHAQAFDAAVSWQPQVQLEPEQGLQAQTFLVASFMTFLHRG